MPENTQRLDIPQSALLTPSRVVLSIVNGPDVGRHFILKKRNTIGTSSRCDIRLADKFISAKHLELEFESNGISIKDLESTNGTYIGSQQIQKANISLFETIKIGRTVFSIIPKIDKRSIESCGLLSSSNVEMKYLFRKMQSIAETNENILIEGETGTGKELVAKSLHMISPQANAPFIAINCGALAPELVESELFGHLRGAFTGAEKLREGAFLAARDGFLFLDEIGELPLALQPKLLRALENREIKPVGSDTPRTFKCRIIAATHRNLKELIKSGKFREDLFFRLNILPLNVPNLRDRKEDIPHLTQQFLQELNGSISNEAIEILTAHPWFGNVRELKNVIIRTFYLSPKRQIEAPDLLAQLNTTAKINNNILGNSAITPLENLEKNAIETVLKQLKGNRSSAARALGLSKSALLNRIKKFSLTV